MRISAATAALLVAVEAVADTEPAGENLSKLSRRHLLFQKHRLFQPKVRLDLRNDDSDDSSTKHNKKSKMGDNWYELDELTDVETTEASGEEKQEKEKLSEYVIATDEKWGQIKVADDVTATYSKEEEDCTELMRRHLSKQDKAGKDSKGTSTITSTWHASTEEAQADSKSGKASKRGKRTKTKSGKEGKSSTIKCHTVPPKSSDKPTLKPSQEIPSGTSSPTSSLTPKPTEATSTPTPESSSTSTVVTESPVASDKSESPTSSPSASVDIVTDAPVTSAVTASPSPATTTESPTGSPSTFTITTESPVAPVTTESPTGSPSASSVETESPVALVTSESPTGSPSASSVETESPVAPVTSESPTGSPSASTVATKSPTSSELSDSPSTSPSVPGASGLTKLPTANPISSTVTEAPVASGSSEAPSASPSTTHAPSTTVITESPVVSAETCTFCEGGIPDPELVVPGTGGQTCAEVKESAADYTIGSELCNIIQDEQSSCCPESTDACTFCSGGIPNPELVVPGTGGQTCAEVKESAAEYTIGSDLCNIIQDEQSSCCPESTDACIFCSGGIPNPELVVPEAGGQTCAEVKESAAAYTIGSELCNIIQDEQSSCCPESTDACTFCSGGIPNPELVVPETGGQTCAEVGVVAAGNTEGSSTCSTIQESESTCCPQSQGGACTPFDPNPYTFEPPNNVFPEAPWSTGGDGEWTIDDTNAQEGTYSIKSPNLEGREGAAFSNATLDICDDFGGGVLNFNTLAPVIPPHDVLVWFVDGVEISRLAGSPEWRVISIPLTPGAHQIDFQYQYNPFDLPELPDSSTSRQGAVWIDAVELVGM